jgi:hypothetical protein
MIEVSTPAPSARVSPVAPENAHRDSGAAFFPRTEEAYIHAIVDWPSIVVAHPTSWTTTMSWVFWSPA